MRYTRRVIARLLTAVLLAPVLWILLHAFVWAKIAPSLAALPVVPMVAGVAVFGILVAIVPPPRKRLVSLDDDDVRSELEAFLS